MNRAIIPHNQKGVGDSPLSAILNEAEARRRARLEDYIAVGRQLPDKMWRRFQRLQESGLVLHDYDAQSDRGSVVWAEPARYYEGPCASGIVLLREDLKFKRGKSSRTHPFAAIGLHALERMITRSGAGSLDEVLEIASGVLCWSHVAKHLNCSGEYMASHMGGAVFCAADPSGIVDSDDPSGRSHHASILTTWISEDRVAHSLRDACDRIDRATSSGIPPFPSAAPITNAQILAFSALHREASDRRASEGIRRERYEAIMSGRMDTSATYEHHLAPGR